MKKTNKLFAAAVAALLALSLFAGCSSDDDDDDDAPAVPVTGITAQIFGNDGNWNYFKLTDGLDTEVAADYVEMKTSKPLPSEESDCGWTNVTKFPVTSANKYGLETYIGSYGAGSTYTVYVTDFTIDGEKVPAEMLIGDNDSNAANEAESSVVDEYTLKLVVTQKEAGESKTGIYVMANDGEEAREITSFSAKIKAVAGAQ
ncbi:hypothetical protein [Treponema porcinum]|uniref:hypothetical protein n=1 Tax=Treponema porcinum TaxID=261392 RepID=UPI003F104242